MRKNACWIGEKGIGDWWNIDNILAIGDMHGGVSRCDVWVAVAEVGESCFLRWRWIDKSEKKAKNFRGRELDG
jgi:hypothetical protein